MIMMMIIHWNSLSQEDVDDMSVSAFEGRLEGAVVRSLRRTFSKTDRVSYKHELCDTLVKTVLEVFWRIDSQTRCTLSEPAWSLASDVSDAGRTFVAGGGVSFE